MNREYELDFVRNSSMIMIILCHVFAEAGIKWGEQFNVGVIIFLFMSGYLAYREEYKKGWVFGKFKRILPEYYIFIFLYLIMTCFFAGREYSIKQFMINILLLQGVFTGEGLPNIMHLWFITYIMICYVATPLLVCFIKKTKCILLALYLMLFQLFIVLLWGLGIEIVCSRFIAYFLGLYFAMKYKNIDKEIKYIMFIKKTVIPISIISLARFYYELSAIQIIFSEFENKVLGMIGQWIHMFLGIFLFFLLWYLGHVVLKKTDGKNKELIVAVSSRSYCIYIVHQIFIYHDYAITRYVNSFFVAILVGILCIIISSEILYQLANRVRYLFKAESEKEK